jgi:hypothetical protein
MMISSLKKVFSLIMVGSFLLSAQPRSSQSLVALYYSGGSLGEEFIGLTIAIVGLCLIPEAMGQHDDGKKYMSTYIAAFLAIAVGVVLLNDPTSQGAALQFQPLNRDQARQAGLTEDKEWPAYNAATAQLNALSSQLLYNLAQMKRAGAGHEAMIQYSTQFWAENSDPSTLGDNASAAFKKVRRQMQQVVTKHGDG